MRSYQILIALAAAGTVAAPALADPVPTAQDIRSGRCTVQPVHTPAGKLIQSSPIVRCTDRDAIAAGHDVPATRGSVPVAAEN